VNYYNEFDKGAAAWLRELVAAKLIPAGHVDERSIVEVSADDLTGFNQCHFFAGIGGWSRALQLAGWPADRPVWTGSCPCQPFSGAGKGEGPNDRRHLWPEMLRLISQCRPTTIFGEQVASAIAHGWLDRVFHDLEAHDYACGAADLCAAGIGAPHVRQRIYWVANSEGMQQHGSDDNESGIPETLGLFSESRDGGAAAKRCGVHWKSDTPELIAMADGIPARMGRLRGYGNAIVPPLASEFISAFVNAAKP
jgi:DNA (cytosine-5)-methyltransferase 1